MAQVKCGVFDQVGAALDPNALNRMIAGVDAAPQRMTPAEVAALDDPVAKLFLATGTIPRTAEQVIDRVKAAAPANSPLRVQSSFIVGEGSQLPVNKKTTNVSRALRFVVTLGRSRDGPDVFLSAFNPRQPGGIEVMAWDKGRGGFNYYRSTRNAFWMFAGNSHEALDGASRGSGPFESHPSGSLIMKELKTPWINWHSPDANILETVFPEGNPLRRHPWFTQKEPLGALTFEVDKARPAMQRWARVRFKKLRTRGGAVPHPPHIVEQIVGTPTVNLTTTHVESRTLTSGDVLDLPVTFFADVEGLTDVLGLAPPPALTVTGEIYGACLEKFDVRLQDGNFRQKGDTHFCFLVPERAAEDLAVLREVIELGLVSKRLAACLLMVDPWNPVFSERRRSLLRHTPDTASVGKDGKSTFSQDMAKTILKAAKSAGKDSPEAAFAARWNVGPKFKPAFDKVLRGYYAAVKRKLRTQADFEPIFKLAEARRRQFAKLPISEFPLLLPRTNIPNVPRRMQSDGTVVEG